MRVIGNGHMDEMHSERECTHKSLKLFSLKYVNLL